MWNPKLKLYDFQKVGAKFIDDAGACIIGDEMGLGKTPQALFHADRNGLDTVIFCPAYLVTNWKQEIEKFLVRTKAKFRIVPYSQLHKESAKIFEQCEYAIFDEVQLLKNLSAQRTQMVHAMMEYAQPKFVAMLSGTPIKNRVVEFYSPLKLLSFHPSRTNGERLSDFYKSEEEFCNAFSVPYRVILGRAEVTPEQFEAMKKNANFEAFLESVSPRFRYKGVQNTKELKRLLVGKYIRRLADKILDLPPIIEKTVKFPVSALKKLDEELQVGFLYGASHLSTTKALSAKAKGSFTAKYALDVIDQTGSAVIFTDHVEACETIFMGIQRKQKCRIITGGTPTANRQAFVAELQEGKISALICTIGSAGVGFNMTRASNVIFNDVSWVPGDNWQALKRVHRIGQTSKCCIHYIAGSDIDEQIIRTLRSKEKELREVL